MRERTNKMKSVFKNIIGYVLVAVMITAGIMIPLLLFEKQEKDMLEKTNFYVYEPQNSEKDSQSVTTVPQYLDYVEMLAVVGAGIPEIKEPQAYEISLEQAVIRARQEIQKLIDMKVIPESIAIQGSSLVDMRYECFEGIGYQKESMRHGFWYIGFSKNDGRSINVIMDAESGIIINLQLDIDSNFDLATCAEKYIEYLGLTDKALKPFGEKWDFVTCVFENEYMTLAVYTEQSIYAEKKTLNIMLEVTGIGTELIFTKNYSEKEATLIVH